MIRPRMRYTERNLLWLYAIAIVVAVVVWVFGL